MTLDAGERLTRRSGSTPADMTSVAHPAQKERAVGALGCAVANADVQLILHNKSAGGVTQTKRAVLAPPPFACRQAVPAGVAWLV
ncbi:MAG TPA: hypothetical protein VIV60_03655 [Polyangiaceae bacterium]